MGRKTVAKAKLDPIERHSLYRRGPRPRSTPDLATNLQRPIGNHALQRLIKSPHAQPAFNGLLARDECANLRRSIGNQALRRLIKPPQIPGTFLPDAEPMEEDPRLWESMTAQNASPAALEECQCASGHSMCPECASAAATASARDALETPAQNHTYTFISRGSYGQTSPGFVRPSCVAAASGAATLVAGAANPTITVFPTGTYQVRRDDGVVQTATCTRLAAGLAATTAHENSHAAGARAGAASANTNQSLPRNFPTVAACAAALPGVLAAWNPIVNAAWANEVAHGPGTNPPTPQTFTQEHAAGTCTFT